jgi:DNA-binding protein YbaB
MKVVMKHVSGSAKANLERAKDEMIRVLAFRGDVVSAKASGQRITLKIEINPKWENEDKVGYLKEWILAKVKSVFEVISVSKSV